MITYEDGRTRNYTYDNAHRVVTEEHKEADGTPIFKHAYTYDRVGNRDWTATVELTR